MRQGNCLVGCRKCMALARWRGCGFAWFCLLKGLVPPPLLAMRCHPWAPSAGSFRVAHTLTRPAPGPLRPPAVKQYSGDRSKADLANFVRDNCTKCGKAKAAEAEQEDEEEAEEAEAEEGKDEL